jgi:hypothetical protein
MDNPITHGKGNYGNAKGGDVTTTAFGVKDDDFTGNGSKGSS